MLREPQLQGSMEMAEEAAAASKATASRGGGAEAPGEYWSEALKSFLDHVPVSSAPGALQPTASPAVEIKVDGSVLGAIDAMYSSNAAGAVIVDEVQSSFGKYVDRDIGFVEFSSLVLWVLEMDKTPFPVNVLECNNPAILVRPDQANTTIGKNVVIGEPRRDEKKCAHRQVALEKDKMGKDKLTITIGPSLQKTSATNEDQEQANSNEKVPEAEEPTWVGFQSDLGRFWLEEPTRVGSKATRVGFVGQDGLGGQLRTFKPHNPEIGTCKSNVPKNAGKVVDSRCTFDKLMDKYKRQWADSLHRL